MAQNTKNKRIEIVVGVDEVTIPTNIDAMGFFNDEIIIKGFSDTQLYMQAGNAVTTTVIANILDKYFGLIDIF